jgi:hypothetical protein
MYSVIVGNGICASFDSVQVNFVSASPLNLGNDTSLCTADTLFLDATTAGGVYHWQDNSSGAIYPVTQSGAYSVTVSVSVCSLRDTIVVGIGSLLPVTITADKNSICASDSVHICSPSGFNTYLWNTGESTACIKTKLAGNYYVTVTDANSCTAESNHLAITVLPLPPVSISVNGDTLNVYDAVTQQWYLNGSPINNATSNTYITNQSGSYTVMVTDSNGCVATSSAVIISGIDDLSEEDVVSVYPNPLSVGGWQLTVGNNFIGSKVEIIDANGKLIFQSEIRDPQSEISADFARGIYLLRISSAKSSVVRKLIRL